MKVIFVLNNVVSTVNCIEDVLLMSEEFTLKAQYTLVKTCVMHRRREIFAIVV